MAAAAGSRRWAVDRGLKGQEKSLIWSLIRVLLLARHSVREWVQVWAIDPKRMERRSAAGPRSNGLRLQAAAMASDCGGAVPRCTTGLPSSEAGPDTFTPRRVPFLGRAGGRAGVPDRLTSPERGTAENECQWPRHTQPLTRQGPVRGGGEWSGALAGPAQEVISCGTWFSTRIRAAVR